MPRLGEPVRPGRKGRSVSRWSIVAIVVCLLAGVAALRPASADAQVPDDTPLRVTFTWPSPPTFCADVSLLPSGVSSQTFLDWVQQSVDAWNVIEADVELRFSGVCPTGWSEDNGRNEIAFTNFDPDDTAVGYALTTHLNTQVIEADVILSVGWEPLTAACWPHVMVHEFGHVLGFSHSEYGTDVMGYGPCSVLSPSQAEVDLLVEEYGVRPVPLDVETSPPDGSTTLALAGTRYDYDAIPGAYFHLPGITLDGGAALLLRAPACFTSDAPALDECSVEANQEDGYWPVGLRSGSLAEIDFKDGGSVVRSSSALDHWSGPLLACNTVGCSQPMDVRIGDVRVNGSGVDFAYLAVPLPDGRVRVQFLNLSFYAPPDLLDVAATFEVRERGVSGDAGIFGACNARLGRTCTIDGDFAGTALDLVLFDSTWDARTGVSVTGIEPLDASVVAGEDVGSSDSPVAGSLPSRGVALVIWVGGPVSLASNDPNIGAIFVASGGVLRGFIVGAPGFVNASFLSTVGEEIAPNTPVVIVVR